MLRMRCLFLLMISLATACATYTPVLTRLNPSGPNVRKAVSGGLTIYVEEHATAEKSQAAFDTNLAEEGVLPLLILVENNSQQAFLIKVSDVVVTGEKQLKPLTPEEAAGKAERSAVGRALGWSMIVPIISIPIAIGASAMHTSSVNTQIVNDFKAKSFPDGELLPRKERSGFLFYELEEGQKDISNARLELQARNAATGETVTVTVPLPNVTTIAAP